MIKSHRPWKATASACERQQLMACLDRDVCHWAWHAVDERSLELCVCVCGRRKEKLGECVSDRRRRCLWVCETKEGVHEVTSRQLFDFPSFPGKQFQEQCRRKTTNHRQLKCHKEKEEEEKKPGAVCWWLNYCRSSRLETEGEMCEWLHSACSRHISPTGLLYPSISQHSSQ